MQNPNSDAPDSTTISPNQMQRNKLLAAILIPLSLIVIFITGASILGQMFAAPKAIADEVPLGARVLVELIGFVGAVAGLISALLTLTNSMNASKFSAAGNREAAADAAAKAQKYGANLILLIGIFSLLLAVKIVQAFF